VRAGLGGLDECPWADLARRGFRGVLFDKDNTLTAPFAHAVHASRQVNLAA
jgi:phosphatidylglycerophosphatase GEP4